MVDGVYFYYGWLIVGGSLAITLLYGIFYAFGVFFTPISNEFGWTSAEISAALSLHAVTYTLSAILMGKLTDAYGPKVPLAIGGTLVGLGLILSGHIKMLLHFYLFYGFLASMGVGAIFIPTYSTVIRWFIKRRGLALGLVAVGAGLGALLIPPFCERLIALYGWRETFMVCGGLSWAVMLVGVLIFKNPSKEVLKEHVEIPSGFEPSEAEEVSRQNITLSMALRTKVFWLLLLMYILFFASTYIPITHVVPFAVAIGISSLTAAGALSLYGASSILGRLTIGFLSDKIGRISALIICFILLAVSISSLIFVQEFFTLYLLVAIFGYAFGGCIPQMPAIIGDFFGSKSVGAIYGVYEGIAFGIGGAIGPVLGGLLKDVTGGYGASFLVGGLMSALALIPLVTVRLLTKK